jgi:hypothetical protein
MASLAETCLGKIWNTLIKFTSSLTILLVISQSYIPTKFSILEYFMISHVKSYQRRRRQLVNTPKYPFIGCTATTIFWGLNWAIWSWLVYWGLWEMVERASGVGASPSMGALWKEPAGRAPLLGIEDGLKGLWRQASWRILVYRELVQQLCFDGMYTTHQLVLHNGKWYMQM